MCIIYFKSLLVLLCFQQLIFVDVLSFQLENDLLWLRDLIHLNTMLCDMYTAGTTKYMLYEGKNLKTIQNKNQTIIFFFLSMTTIL